MDVRPGWFAALCPVCGLEVLSPGPESRQNARLELSTGRVIALISHGRYPVIQHGGGVSHQILVSGQDGVAYVVTEIDWGVRRLGDLYGRMADWTADGRAAWQDSRETYRIDGDPKVYDAPLPDGASGGFIGDPRWPGSWPEYWSANPLTACGVTVFNPMVSPDNAWVIGNHPDKPIHLAHDVEADVLYEAGPSFNTPIAPRVVMRNGEPVIVRSYPSGLLTRDQFVPYVAAAPPVRVPTFRPAVRPIGCGLFFDYGGGPTIAPVTSRYPASLPRPAFLMSVGSDHAEAVSLASAAGVPVLAYADRHGLTPRDVPAGERAGVYCYPEAGVPVATTLALVLEELRALTAAGIPCDLVVATYCQYLDASRGYALTEQQVIDVLAGCWEMAIAFNVGAVWGFARERTDHGTLVDGVDYWPGLREAWHRLKAASPNPSAFPVRATRPTVPSPMPTPIPVPVPIPAPATFYARARSL